MKDSNNSLTTLAISFATNYQYLSEETLKDVGPLYLVSRPRRSKRSHKGGNLSWTILEKDNSGQKCLHDADQKE